MRHALSHFEESIMFSPSINAVLVLILMQFAAIVADDLRPRQVKTPDAVVEKITPGPDGLSILMVRRGSGRDVYLEEVISRTAYNVGDTVQVFDVVLHKEHASPSKVGFVQSSE